MYVIGKRTVAPETVKGPTRQSFCASRFETSRTTTNAVVRASRYRKRGMQKAYMVLLTWSRSQGVFDKRLHGFTCFRSQLVQTFDSAAAVRFVSILAELPLAFQTFDGEFDSYNPFGERLDVIIRCVSDLPRLCEGRFVEVGQGFEVVEQPRGVFYELEVTVGMDNDVVPRRNNFAGTRLLGIPGWRDVVLRAGKDSEGLYVRRNVAPLRIGPGKMAFEQAKGAWGVFQHQRQMRGGQAGAAQRNERTERLRPYELVQDGNPCFFKSFRTVHDFLWPPSGICRISEWQKGTRKSRISDLNVFRWTFAFLLLYVEVWC